MLGILGLLWAAGCAPSRAEHRGDSRAVPEAAEEEVVLGNGAWTLGPQVAAEVAAESPTAKTHGVVLDALPGAPTVEVVSLVQPTGLEAPHAGGAAFRALLGQHAMAECLVRKDRLDMASAMRGVVADLTARPDINRTAVSVPSPAQGNSTAVLLVTVEYLTALGRYGALRLAAANVADAGVFCSLEAPGHARTFERMVMTLVKSLEHALPHEGQTREHFFVTLDGGWQGTAEQVHITRSDGRAMDLQFVSMVRVAGATLHSVDEVGVELADPEGNLMLLRSMRRENGEMSREGSLTRGDDGRVGIKLHNQERTVDLGRADPVGVRGLRTHLAAAQNTRGLPRTFLRYLPGMDARALAEETVELEAPVDGGARFVSRLATQAGAATARYVVDHNGALRQSTITWGDTQLTITRVVAP